MNRILSVVRSMTDKIIELSRAVVTAPASNGTNPLGQRRNFRTPVI